MVAKVKSVRTWRDDFWDKVNKAGPEVRPGLGPCWIWTGTTDKDGYGLFDRGGKKWLAHRVSYEMKNGPLGRNFVLHKCDNPPCVNWDHHTPGTNADNLRDMAEKGRARGGRRTKDGREPINRRRPEPSGG